MSSTSRGGVRNVADNYPTPSWCVHRLLEAVELPAGAWLEPCIGEGSIVRAVELWHGKGAKGAHWYAHELRRECELRELRELVGPFRLAVEFGDYLAPSRAPRWPRFDVAIANPPFRDAEAFVRTMRCEARQVLALLRLNFLGGAGRNVWLRDTRPDVYVLPDRPSFANKCRARPACRELLGPFVFRCSCGAPASPQTDSVEYAWFHFYDESAGRLRVLPTTPLEERRRNAPNPLDGVLGGAS